MIVSAINSEKPVKKKGRRFLRYLFYFFLIYRLFVDTFGEMGFVKYGRMVTHYNDLTYEIARFKADNRRLQKEIHYLKNDPDYLEKIARDKLGLARPGEIVYYYGDQ